MEGIKISVIIPVYNGAKTIVRAMASVSHQTYHNVELIVVNDGSKDNTDEVVRDFLKSIEIPFDYVVIENGGLANARNVGWSKATGDFCCNLDADDYLEPSIFESVVNSRQSFDICYYGFRSVSTNGVVLNQYTDRFKYLTDLNGIDAAAKKLKREIWICQGSAIYNRRMIENNGIKNIPGINQGEDLLFITSALSVANKVCCIEAIGVNIEESLCSMMHMNYNDSFLQSIKASKLLQNKLTCYNNKELNDYSYKEVVEQTSRVAKVIAVSKTFSLRTKLNRISEIKNSNVDNINCLKGIVPSKKYIEYWLLAKIPVVYTLLVKIYRIFEGDKFN